jgi:outer membrane protein
MKRILIIIILGTLGASVGWSEQLSKIAVIDLSEIVSSYYKESAAWRELEELTKKYEEEKDSILEEISQLESRRVEAIKEGDDQEELRLDDEIFKKKEYLQEYTRIKFNQIQKMRNSLVESPTFLSAILREIRVVASLEGYTMVMRTNDPDLMWWSPEIDITPLVIERLRRSDNR